jgi:hypothetical protein
MLEAMACPGREYAFDSCAFERGNAEREVKQLRWVRRIEIFAGTTRAHARTRTQAHARTHAHNARALSNPSLVCPCAHRSMWLR